MRQFPLLIVLAAVCAVALAGCGSGDSSDILNPDLTKDCAVRGPDGTCLLERECSEGETLTPDGECVTECGEGEMLTWEGECVADCADGEVLDADGKCVKNKDKDKEKDKTKKCKSTETLVDGECKKLECKPGEIAVGGVCKEKKVEPVKIASSKIQTGCVLNGAGCGGKLRASGGSGKYKWSMSGTLPEGLAFDGGKGASAAIDGNPTRMTAPASPAKVSVTVEDAADSANKDSKEFDFTVKGVISFSARKNVSQAYYEPVKIADDKIGDLILGLEDALELAVPDWGSAYRWEIGVKRCYKSGSKTDECNGENKGLILGEIGQDVSNERALFSAVSSRGYRFEEVVISATDGFGNKASVTIASVTFEDPCGLFKIQPEFSVTLNPSQKDWEEIAGKLQAEGGIGPYVWKVEKSVGIAQAADMKSGRTNDRSWVVEGLVDPSAVTLGNMGKIGWQAEVSVTDEGCQKKGTTTLKLGFDDAAQKQLQDPLAGMKVSIEVGEVDDVDDSPQFLQVSFLGDNEKVLTSVRFDTEKGNRNGDEVEEFSQWVPGGVVGKISDIKRIKLHVEDNSYSENLDWDIRKIKFSTAHWEALYDDEAQPVPQLGPDITMCGPAYGWRGECDNTSDTSYDSRGGRYYIRELFIDGEHHEEDWGGFRPIVGFHEYGNGIGDIWHLKNFFPMYSMGGIDGGPFQDRCSSGNVVAGFSIRQGSYLDQIQFWCKAGKTIKEQNPRVFPGEKHGGEGSDYYTEAFAPPGFAFAGFRIKTKGNPNSPSDYKFGNVVIEFVPIAKKVDSDGTQEFGPYGKDDENSRWVDMRCPSNRQYLIGIQGRSGNYVNALGPLCAKVPGLK